MVKPMGPDPRIGHDPGSGPLPAHTPILIDLWPRDEESSCWSDMSRTFVRGDITDRIADLHALVLSAHEQSCAAVRPGVKGVELYGIACDVFEAAGYPTGCTKRAGETLREGFYHGLGHGVGLAVHEPPILGRTGTAPLIAGDVIALIQPGTVDRSVGGRSRRGPVGRHRRRRRTADRRLSLRARAQRACPWPVGLLECRRT